MKRKIIRKWLNPITSGDSGWIKFSLSSDSHSVNCQLNIADCDRQITLDLDSSSEKWHNRNCDQALKKLDVIIDSLNEIREEYIEHYENHLVLKKEHNKKNKKKNIPA